MRPLIPRGSAWALSLLVVCARPSAGQSPSPDSQQVRRLAAVGRLWGVVKYFHPSLPSRAAGWDSAVAAAIPRVWAARDSVAYAAAVGETLAALGDRWTRVVPPASGAAAPPEPITSRWTPDSTLVVSVPAFTGDSAVGQLRALVPQVRAARWIVFDLRGPEPPAEEYGDGSYVFRSAGLNALLPARPVAAPSLRRRMFSGFPPQSGSTSGGYWAGSYVTDGGTFTPASGNLERRVAFVVHATSDVPFVAYALQTSGQGTIVLDDAHGSVLPVSPDFGVPLGEGVEARVSVGELLGASGRPVAADTAAGRNDAADVPLQLAMTLVRAVPHPRPAAAETAAAVAAPERTYADQRYPPLPLRVLAAYRWWNAIAYFYPYKALIGQDWNAVLPRSIERLAAAGDSLQYAQAVAQMVAEIHDSHGFVASAALAAWMGRAPAGALVQYVEGQPVVVRVADDSATRASGIAVGDVIVSVDGESAAARRARFVPYLAHSTPQALDDAVATRLLLGPEGSIASIEVRGPGARVREVRLPRRMALFSDVEYPRSGPILRLLPGNVGYADLARLTVGMVDSMFEMFRGTRAIIFDGRGYPQGTAWAIAPRLTDRGDVVAARFERPLVMAPDSIAHSTYTFMQSIPKTDQWRYHGRTVMLMDERTISQAEHTGLFFEAANHTMFVGSPTMGANGDVTTVVLPGGITVGFTGHDVRHADGRQLQRVGLVPDVLVRPTIAGIRAGRDEVLERALRFLGRRDRTAR